MASDKLKAIAHDILAQADIRINGDQPWDLQVHNEDFYGRVLGQGGLGLGESYMEGWWDAEQLDAFFFRLLRLDLSKSIRGNWRTQLFLVYQALVNRQRKSKAHRVGEHHYDKGNDLYQAMLDQRLVYSCAYWKEARTLDEAQEAKLDLVCRKIGLEPGLRVLDVGCGWGSFAKYAAEHYGVTVVGINNSKEQTQLGRALCAGLPIEIKMQDYREVSGTYDRIVSLGMFEHVGPKNYRTYMDVAHRSLTDEGLFLLHTIGGNKSLEVPDLWTDRYIFPGGVTPSIKQIGASIEGQFVMEDWHNFGADYDKTLMAWFANFDASWEHLKPRYGEGFYRMWKYFLLSFAGSFRARQNQLWQVVLSKKGVVGGYVPVR